MACSYILLRRRPMVNSFTQFSPECSQVIDYYRLRFQIEFNFRDAKQYWGLEDFMVVNRVPVYNSANLAMFMVNVSHAVMHPLRPHWPEFSVNDLKTWFRSRK